MLRLGANSDGGERFQGEIDEARIYQQALSADTVKALYDETACH